MVFAAFGGPWRNYKVAHNHRRLVTLIEGEFWGGAYGAYEDALALLGEPFQASLNFLGFPWAGRVAGIDLADPILVATLAVERGTPSVSLLFTLLVPLGVALVLGKVFCSHLCPARLAFELGQAFRRGLGKIGVDLPEVTGGPRIGHWVLVGGLLSAALTGTAVWYFILPYAGIGAALSLAISGSAPGAIGLSCALYFLADALAAPGYFCRNLCPTGALLGFVGKKSLLQLEANKDIACPTGCTACTRACPYRLSPRSNSHRSHGCDNCGVCAGSCPTERLSRRFHLPVITATLLTASALAAPTGAEAHHNKGLPHYGYFENYPQVPTEEYINIDGRWEIGATLFNFQGMDRRQADTPNDVKIYSYLYDLKLDRNFRGSATFEIVYDGEVVSRFERVAVDEEAVYSTRETLPHSGDYLLVARFEDQVARLPFHVDLASDVVSWTVLALILAPVFVVFALALLGRKKRRMKKKSSPLITKSSPLGVLLLPIALAMLAPGVPALAQPSKSGAARPQEAAAPQGVVCPHCGMINCTMDHYETDEGAVMVMGGIPYWLFLLGIGGVIALSFVATERFGAPRLSHFRVNLLKNRRLYRLVRSRWFQMAPQLFVATLLGYLIYAGLAGSSIANITPVAVWTLWWAALIFVVLFMGSAWCFVCPWDGVANLVSRLGLGKGGESLSLDLPFPKALQNLYPAIALFAVLTWLELGWGVTTNARATAYMGLGMTAAATIAALLWGGKRFCAHICPVGRICGIYSNFSPIEIRARNPRSCETCTTEDCLHGAGDGQPCPTGISLKAIQQSTNCTACTECIKSCKRQNVAVNLRPFGSDLAGHVEPTHDQAWLALSLLALTLFHGLSMTPAWENFAPGGQSVLKWMSLTFGTPRILNFSAAMVLALMVPVLLYWASCAISARWAGQGINTGRLFINYAYSLLPVALFYHLAHNLMHLLMEGGAVVPLLSDPLGNGTDYFGTRNMHVGSLVSDQAIAIMQVLLILAGHVFGIVSAHRIGHRLYENRQAAMRSLATMPIMMILISVGGLWLMHMDMNMRVGRM